MSAPDEVGVRRFLVTEIAGRLGLPEPEVDVHRPLEEYGLQSRDAVELSGMLEDLLDRPLEPTLVFRHPTIAGIAAFLGAPADESAPEPDPGPAAGREPVAVVGLGCRFPGGADSPTAFWDLLVEGRDGVRELPAGRWGHEHAPGVPTRGGFLDDVAGFDAAHFGIAPHEAAAMDPQQRLLLEVAWEALEHAGVPPRAMEGSPTGVFIGASTMDYGYLSMASTESVEAWTGTGSSLGVIANRLSYLLGLEGPSMVIDTACSASLVALHLAVRSLLADECTLAVAGGVNLMLHPAVTATFEHAGLLAPDGWCKTFDAAADGFVRGEGCGVVVLKRLSAARADGDRVLALVLGSAVNQDGRSNGLMAPNPRSQVALLRRAYADAGVDPATVGYVEAHGTGTELGDPIEVGALGEVLPARDDGRLLGSVKTNLGHLEAAAGMAGLIKTVLALGHGEVPPSLHYRTPSPHIPFAQLGLRVATERAPWPGPGGQPRRAGVSAFGFAGTNAHVVLEQAPVAITTATAPTELTGRHAVFPLSASSPAALRTLASRLADWLDGPGRDVPLADVGHTLALRRSAERHRAAVVAADHAGLAAALREGPETTTARRDARAPVWVFSGQGSQWAGMGHDPLADEPAFRAVVDELEPVVAAESGFSLTAVLRGDSDVTACGIDVVQPAVFAMQLGLAAVWRARGSAPSAVVGHSMGEVAAAVVAEALTPADGARVVCRRSRLLTGVAGLGAMAVVAAPEREVAALVAAGAAVVAVVAAPNSTVVSGDADAVAALLARLDAHDVDAREVQVDVASHSPQMDPLLAPLVERLADLAPVRPALAFYSTVSDDPRATPAFDATYWANNLRRPVRLADAVGAAAADGHEVFVEVSPHPVLTRSLADTLHARGFGEPLVLPTAHRELGVAPTMLAGLAALHRAGVPLDWTVTFGAGRPAELPVTAWDRHPHWVEVTPRAPVATRARAGEDWRYRLDWPVQPPPAAAPRPGGWLLLADRGGVAAALRTQLAAAGTTVRMTPAGRADTLGPDELDGVGTVVHCGALDADAHAGADPQRAAALTTELADLVRRLAAAPQPPALVLVTRFAQAVGGEPRVNAAQAALWGAGRCVAVEHPELWGALVDLDDADPATAASRLLVEAGAPGEQQVALRGGTRHVARLHRAAEPLRSGAFAAGGSHLVVGGTGRLGPHLLAHLAHRGVRHLAVVSRSGLRGAAAEQADALRAVGVTITDLRADVADERAMAEVFDRFGTDLPPLHGVYQAAFDESLAPLAELDRDGVAAMFAAKVTGTAVLDRLTAGHPVRTFLCVSSTTALLGSWLLTAYAAANATAEAIAHARAARGLPAATVVWGPWFDGHGEGEHREAIEASGLRLMAAGPAVAGLDAVLDDGPGGGAALVVADADWAAVVEAYSTRTALPVLDDLLPRAATAGPAPIAPSAPAAPGLPEPGPARHAWVREQVGAVVAGVLKLSDPAELDPDRSFFELGLDSLLGVVVRKRVTKRVGFPLAAKAVFLHPSVTALSEHVLERLAADPEGP